MGIARRVQIPVKRGYVSGSWEASVLYADGIHPIAELDGQGNVVETFVYGTRPNVPDLMIKGGVAYRIISDQLGSPVEVINTATGAVVEQITYDAWGNVTSDTNPGFQPFGFAGGLYDADTGLVHFGARDYDPVIGRWATRDPLGFAGGDTNLYGYALQDPVNLIDLKGKDPVLAAAGAAIGLGVGLINGYISGDRGMALLEDSGAGAAAGGLIGLTDGLSLLEGVGARAAISVSAEALREEVNNGCLNTSNLAYAAAASTAGDFAGNFTSESGAITAEGATHQEMEPSKYLESAVSSATSGAFGTTSAAIQGANGGN